MPVERASGASRWAGGQREPPTPYRNATLVGLSGKGAGAPGLSTPCGELQPKPRHMLVNGAIGTSARAGCTMPNAAAPAIWRRVSCSAAVQGRSAAARAVIDTRMVRAMTQLLPTSC